MRPEDKPKTLVFVDILGFGPLTTEERVRVKRSHHHPFTIDSTTEMPNRINRFNRVLDQCLAQQNGDIQAMLFSDCAYMVFDNSLYASVVATDLMRSFIKSYVPVRMGLGRGTFYNIERSTSSVGVTVNKSRFIGTAVVFAHKAEQCGGKGMRIFLDASIEPDVQLISSRIKAMPLVKPLKSVKWELDYLHESGPNTDEIESGDRTLFENVAQLKDPKWRRDVQRQYTQTFAAMNRMRKANNRRAVNTRTLKYGGPSNLYW